MKTCLIAFSALFVFSAFSVPAQAQNLNLALYGDQWYAGGNRVSFVHKFGRNPDIDTATDPEDVISWGGTYSFPSSAGVAEVASSSALDTAAGTGARTVMIQGVDTDCMYQEDTLTLSGTDTVRTTNTYLRVFRAYVLTVGTGETNAGDITVSHNANILAQIDAGHGQTLQAVYTIPKDYLRGVWLKYFATVEKDAGTGNVVLYIQARNENGAWRTLETFGIASGSSGINSAYHSKSFLQPCTDLRLRVNEVSANDFAVSGGFEIMQVY